MTHSTKSRFAVCCFTFASAMGCAVSAGDSGPEPSQVEFATVLESSVVEVWDGSPDIGFGDLSTTPFTDATPTSGELQATDSVRGEVVAYSTGERPRCTNRYEIVLQTKCEDDDACVPMKIDLSVGWASCLGDRIDGLNELAFGPPQTFSGVVSGLEEEDEVKQVRLLVVDSGQEKKLNLDVQTESGRVLRLKLVAHASRWR